MEIQTTNIKNKRVYPCPAIIEPVKMALILRRQEIASTSTQSVADTPPINVEESLRQLMVKAVPGLRKSRLTAAQVSYMINWVEDITRVVSAEDIRMIDALNVVYESWPESWEEYNRDKFLKYYAYALDRMISQI